jgi:nanoRNase/pAp phosphatase (c-di-AMP/oligoRNAs hydrolase)
LPIKYANFIIRLKETGALQDRLELLLAAVAGVASLLILPHNDPDPDAIASALALRHLLFKTANVVGHIGYEGIIGRAENKALVNYLGYPLQHLSMLGIPPGTPVALVDTQPGAGNNALPAGAPVAIVVDHHALRPGTASAAFADIRTGAGSTSTILTEYLQAAGIQPTTQLATALFYGIKTDTMRLGRGINPVDVAAYFYLQPLMDVEALVEIEQAQVPADYFKSFAAALGAAHIHEGIVFSYVGDMNYPDLAAEMADLLLRLQGARWVIAMGVYKGDMILAVRTRRQNGAGRLVQAIVGERGAAGGHSTMAGGRMPLDGLDPQQLVADLQRRALAYLDVPAEKEGRPLV